ncbi:MAG: redoxin domain-containing protein [Phycisphaerae bacterium]|nr:redoxin domain-containing protein [Phycisphaerae bacterium]NIP54229.1 redoxin domain-containing protein [Phycisphaerae bacterium]NIS50180.1 redoxin domain-containing protein [Phycisphaerae bacterium]NIU07834.1 redoxin domain-containing protein [Phycisphaerae bacterium]NIU55443.1 redoxin domain-containing protein [Phycisphaerae bacterium]
MSKCRQSILVAALILFTSCLGISATKKPKTLEIGAKAPDFNLPGVDGKYYKLASFNKADFLVVIFTCNHCPTAQAYEERMKKIAANYKNKGVAVVAISPNDPKAVRLDELGYSDLSDSLEEMKIRAKDKKFNFPYLYDGDLQKVSRAYGPVTTPHVFIFDKERKLQYVGRIDDSEKPKRVKSRDTRNAIEALLSGKEVPVKKTRTFGCSIKWSNKRDSVKKAFEKWAKEPVNVKMIDADGIRKLVKNDSKKLRLFNVWATWCGPCVVEFDELVSINRMYRGRDFEMITLSADSPARKDNVLSFLKKKQASCNNYLFNSENKYELMGAVDTISPGGIPYTILVKPGGKVIYRRLGLIDPLELKKVIVEYLGRTYQ